MMNRKQVIEKIGPQAAAVADDWLMTTGEYFLMRHHDAFMIVEKHDNSAYEDNGVNQDLYSMYYLFPLGGDSWALSCDVQGSDTDSVFAAIANRLAVP